jgi:two-component system sensor histidine kinase DesK
MQTARSAAVRHDPRMGDTSFRQRVRIRLGVALGLLFLIGPIADLANEPLSDLRKALILLGTAAFCVVYMLLVGPSPLGWQCGGIRFYGPLAALPAIGVILLAAGAPASYAALFIYFVAAAAVRMSVRHAVAVIALTVIAMGIGCLIEGVDTDTTASLLITVIAIGAMMAAFGRKIAANRELQEAREELAELAVAEERLRIARDLHDLLGHSLSVIALKSELASRLMERDAAAAARELDDIQSVTRNALAEVREAVQGYRRQGLADALERADAALRAAGIECELDRSPAELPPDVESVLAWAVREGATNVVRHSGAQHCSIRVLTEPTRAAVEVEDNGASEQVPALTGSGLAGLAERAHAVHGTLEASKRPEGGFRLRLTVPLPST